MRGAWSIVLVAVVLALGYAGLRRAKAPDQSVCQVCRRPVHAHSRTVAMVVGRSEVFCCPSCAMSQRDQTGKPVAVTQLTDYLTGARLAPAQAWIVRASDVNPCLGQQTMVDADKRAAAVEFDRCAPSLLAFARREDAAAFASRHGGKVLPFSALAAGPAATSPARSNLP